ncbi:hypothetical protein AB6A40_005514 [Gnathostoma spinigerum]|uniref:heparosan-N-sulfate-glucuronate 5-epimerase n=1 Tax=Gnathostoma spinigerum TaxID=75299 RepID=A0ABD6EGS8_9BILA
MLRFSTRSFFILLISAISLYILAHNALTSEPFTVRSISTFNPCNRLEISTAHNSFSNRLQQVECIVDGSTRYQCISDGTDVYFPFDKFLKKRFDISGKHSKNISKNRTVFEWSTSYAKIRLPDSAPYDPFGAFGHFAQYSVETRDRVRCINGKFGVPMSVQWQAEPYFYPIQIAQYALQHYSRNKTGGSEWRISVGNSQSDWNIHDNVRLSITFSHDLATFVTSLKAKGLSGSAELRLNSDTSLNIVSFKWMPQGLASFTVRVRLVEFQSDVLLNYILKNDSRCVWFDPKASATSYNYALDYQPISSDWNYIVRDILVDTGRAISSTSSPKHKLSSQPHPGDISLVSITFRGNLSLYGLQQRSSAHMDHFFTGAEWLLSNQDSRGGWPVPAERSIADKRLILKAGWHSAMAQGHALSVLTRAYGVTKDEKFLQSAARALALFRTPVSEGGIRNELFGHAWYEEYPTTPGTYVLNGFMYSLIGLYDFMSVNHEQSVEAEKLFKDGLSSLIKFLPLFDTGSGSIYDLRHIGLQTAPNLARWDYHAVHIYLLKWLFNLTKRKELDDVAVRWISYAKGHRAKHN